MLKKFFIILITLLCMCSCVKNYKCVLKYQVTYPDTTWVHTYVFDGTWEAKPRVYTSSNGRKTLSVYPYGGVNVGLQEIAAVPSKDSDITVLDFKIYRYGVDIPKKEK